MPVPRIYVTSSPELAHRTVQRLNNALADLGVNHAWHRPLFKTEAMPDSNLRGTNLTGIVLDLAEFHDFVALASALESAVLNASAATPAEVPGQGAFDLGEV